MAQQTINVGTAPNDGTGTPLRTAFQYTNSNFSELYTALGGGSGLPGASTQVLFNNGTNIAGDAGLVYNSTTDALTIGGNVQAASATITGDLTVDTSTLKVDSTNNRVGIGTASPGRSLDVIGTEYISSQLLVGTTSVPSGSAVKIAANGAAGSDSYLQCSNGSGGGMSIGSSGGAGLNLYTFTGVVGSETNTTKRLTVDSNGVFTFENVGGVAGTAMTLNSTGLGVGASPAYKLDIAGSGRFTNNIYVPSSVTYKVGPLSATWAGLRFDSANAMFLDSDASISFRVNGGTSFATAMVLTSSNNIQIANTASAPAAPASGGVLYVEAGALKYRGSSGTVTTIANA